VSFQGLRDAQSVGYIIPSSVLRRTIEDFTASEASAAAAAAATAAAAAASASAAGAAAVAPAPEVAAAAPPRSSREGVKLRGFATFAPSFQTMENEALRRANGLNEAGASGVLLYAVPRVSNLRGVLEEGDVLVAVDGERISNDGRVKRGENSPMDFRVCVTMKLVGEPIRYSIVRAGQRREVEAAAGRRAL
jgi:S1-C subfamily serine protease